MVFVFELSKDGNSAKVGGSSSISGLLNEDTPLVIHKGILVNIVIIAIHKDLVVEDQSGIHERRGISKRRAIFKFASFYVKDVSVLSNDV